MKEAAAASGLMSPNRDCVLFSLWASSCSSADASTFMIHAGSAFFQCVLLISMPVLLAPPPGMSLRSCFRALYQHGFGLALLKLHQGNSAWDFPNMQQPQCYLGMLGR